MTATRQVYLISFKARNSRDHWGLYFPSAIQPERYGKILHVVGSPQFGFKYEVKHYWSQELSKTPFTLHLLGETDATNIVDAPVIVEDDLTRLIAMVVTDDLNRDDKFENRAVRHAPPKVASSLIPTGRPSEVLLALQRDIPGMRRCQEWTSDFIDDLVKQGLLPEAALEKRDAVRADRIMPPEVCL